MDGRKVLGAGVSEAVLEYACDGGFVSRRDCRCAVLALTVSILVCAESAVGVVSRLLESSVSCGPTCSSTDRAGVTMLGDVEVGELWAERYRLFDEGRFRNAGSDRLAIALEVFSLAKAAKFKIPARLCFEELVEGTDWRCL